MLYFLGEDMREKLAGCQTTSTDDQQYQQLVKVINDSYKPIGPPVQILRNEFSRLKQEHGERASMFHLSLTAAAQKAFPDGTVSAQIRSDMIRQQFLSNLTDKSSNKHFKLHFSHYSTNQMLDYFRRNEEVDASLQDEHKAKPKSGADFSIRAEQFQPIPHNQTTLQVITKPRPRPTISTDRLHLKMFVVIAKNPTTTDLRAENAYPMRKIWVCSSQPRKR